MYLNNIIKPTHICNLTCSYCFNEDPRDPIMTDATLERVIQQSFAYVKNQPGKPFVSFIWHGGEPMVAKIPYYETAVKFQKMYCKNIEYSNTIQTNGTLINDKWIAFFQENDFTLSISLDGPKEINDRVRNYRGNKSSFDKVMAGIQLTRQANLPFGVPVVISKANMHDAEKIIDFFIQEKLHFHLIPLTRSGDAITHFTDLGLDAEDYAEPWITMYDRWFYAKDDEYIYCTDFVYKSAAILAGRDSDCIGMKQCGSGNISIDPDGYVYPCATYSADDTWLYGNIRDTDLEVLMTSTAAKKAIHRVEDPHCTSCKWRNVCNGGCPSRAYKFFGSADTRDYYCPSLYKIYEHVEKRLREIQSIDLSKLPDPNRSYQREAPKARALIEKEFQRRTEKTIKFMPIGNTKQPNVQQFLTGDKTDAKR